MVAKHQQSIERTIAALLPAAPFADAQAILQIALSSKFSKLPSTIGVWLATVSYIRHSYTQYDEMLDDGYDRESARFFVLNEINDILTAWHAKRLLTVDENYIASHIRSIQ